MVLCRLSARGARGQCRGGWRSGCGRGPDPRGITAGAPARSAARRAVGGPHHGLGSVLFVLDVATTGGAVTVFGAAAAALGFGGFVSSGFDYWKLSADENARTTELSDLTKEAEQIRATRAHLRQAGDVLRPKTTWQTASGDPTLEPARTSPPPDKP